MTAKGTFRHGRALLRAGIGPPEIPMRHPPFCLLLPPALLVLHFDGSFTPASRSSPPFASCGAAVLSSDDDLDGGCVGGRGGVLAVGGRVLPPPGDDDDEDDDQVGGHTSARAEYEGLLLGLRFVLDGLAGGTLSLSPTPPPVSSSVEPPRGTVAGGEVISSARAPEGGIRRGAVGGERRGRTGGLLTIRGDCRTVVDQLNGSSTPRRLRRHHARAAGLLDQIRRTTGEDGGGDDDDGDAGPPLRIDVELVPRDGNSLADALAREAGAVARRDAIGRVRNHVALASPPGAETDNEHHLSNALDLIAGGDGGGTASAPVPLPIDVRISLLREVATAAGRVGDASALASAGAALRGEARNLPATVAGGKKSSRPDGPRAAVEAEGIRLEIAAMRMRGRDGEADGYVRRHRYRLRRFPARDDVLGRGGTEEASGCSDSRQDGDSSSGPQERDGEFAGLLGSWSSEASAGMERLVSREGVFLVL